jgi:hypothetical protein
VDQKKVLLAITAILWSGFVVAAYFVVQKPFALQVIDHLWSLAWTFIVSAVLLCNALALGTITIKWFLVEATEDPSWLALAGGIGLGELGLLGFVLAAAGASKFWILLAAQILLLGWFAWKGTLQSIFPLIKNSIIQVRSSGLLIPSWMKWAAILALILTFLMTLLPPADAFDALLYHLTIPERWLQDGGIRAYDFPHYWFPGLVEGAYFWGLGLGSEIVPQQLHFAWAVFAAILIWSWARRTWGDLTAWWGLVLMISMPSLLRIASWAYTDMALVFFGVAMLYSLSYGKEQANTRWWSLSAISAGLAMGVKYTSFVMPVTAVLLISAWTFQKKREWFAEVLKFTLLSTAIALIWYLRNWIWMGNPFYPFVFGGRYWDPFRAAWYSGAGSGSGWDLKSLILLPLTLTLGYQDANSIDSDIGPLLLLAFPLALWALAKREPGENSRKVALTTIGFFAFLSAAFWVFGYVTTSNLWQTRLLLPAIVPFVIPAAVGLTLLSRLDTRQLRLYFIVSSIAAVSIYVNLLDLGLSVIARNPLSIVAGIATKQNYLERYQPEYAYALQLASQTPPDSRIYCLFEPRTYGMPRRIQPDPLLGNFSHDVYLNGDPEEIVNAWRLQGYTHVLLNKRGASFILNNTGESSLFDQTLDLLEPVSITQDGSYELLEIPAGASE